MSMETPNGDDRVRASTTSDGLERDLERTLFEKVQEENHSLRMELDRVTMMMKVNSSGWSEGERNRYTPNGTQVPDGVPPSVEVPPWPFPVHVEEHEMAEESGRWMWSEATSCGNWTLSAISAASG